MTKRKQKTTSGAIVPAKASKTGRQMPHAVAPDASFENHVKPFLDLFNAIFPALQDVPALRNLLADNLLEDREIQDAIPMLRKQFQEIYADIDNRDATGEESAVAWTKEEAERLYLAAEALCFLMLAFPVAIRTPKEAQL